MAEPDRILRTVSAEWLRTLHYGQR